VGRKDAAIHQSKLLHHPDSKKTNMPPPICVLYMMMMVMVVVVVMIMMIMMTMTMTVTMMINRTEKNRTEHRGTNK